MSKRLYGLFYARGRKSAWYWPVPSTRNVTKGVSILSIAWLLYALGSESQGEFWWLQASGAVLGILGLWLVVWCSHRYWRKRAQQIRAGVFIQEQRHAYFETAEDKPGGFLAVFSTKIVVLVLSMLSIGWLASFNTELVSEFQSSSWWLSAISAGSMMLIGWLVGWSFLYAWWVPTKQPCAELVIEGQKHAHLDTPKGKTRISWTVGSTRILVLGMSLLSASWLLRFAVDLYFFGEHQSGTWWLRTSASSLVMLGGWPVVWSLHRDVKEHAKLSCANDRDDVQPAA